jgi:very-short-patch-repair endonuclease
VDWAIGRLAEGQHGIVSRSQLSELGLERGAVEHRLKVGRLRPVHRGVYTVGHRLLTQSGRWMAAVLACGPDAVLSHHAAAGLWGIRHASRLEVTAPSGRRGPPRVRLHRAHIPADERTIRHGIPTTTVPRTLLDLSAVVQRAELRSAWRQAEQLRLTDRLSVPHLIARYPRRSGTTNLRAILKEAEAGLPFVRSELEERFQTFLLNAGIPSPETNQQVENLEVDCVWREAHLIVELDSRTFHDTTLAFEEDRRRDRRLEAAGWHVIRITWRQLLEEPDAIEADLRKLL